jgi:hypothetical protein
MFIKAEGGKEIIGKKVRRGIPMRTAHVRRSRFFC